MLSDPRKWGCQCQKELEEKVSYKDLLKCELTKSTWFGKCCCVCFQNINVYNGYAQFHFKFYQL